MSAGTFPDVVSSHPMQARDGSNRRRLRRLFSENFDAVWRLLRRFGVPAQVADDAAQEVFVILAERMADVKLGSERAFMYGTALRLASSWRRTKDREVPSGDDEAVGSLPNVEELTDQKRARDLLDQILQRMEAPLRDVFVLYEIEGLTIPEVAEVVAIPGGTAASRLRRAREAFRVAVQRVAGEPGQEAPRPLQRVGRR